MTLFHLTTSPSRLNPCCCGRWSQRVESAEVVEGQYVLILVVVEDGLRESG